MGTIAIATFRTVVDALAKSADTIETDFGTADSPGTPADVSDSAQGLLDTLEALSDTDVLIDLLPGARDWAALALGSRAKKELRARALVDALEQHVGGFKAFLDANADGQGNPEQVAAEFRDAYGKVSPKYVFPPAISDMGSFAVTGSGAGTFTDGSAVDTGLYGICDIEVEVINQAIQAAAINVTAVCTDFEGNTVNRTVTIPAASTLGTKITFDAGAWIVDVTNITIVGGTNGDDFQINGILRRAIAL